MTLQHLRVALLTSLMHGMRNSAAHVLFLMSDSHDGRFMDATSPVYDQAVLPNLRELAERGTNFIRTYSSSPQCTPSRTAMFTGRRTDQIKCWRNGMAIARVPGTGDLDESCVKGWGRSTCAAWAAQQNVTATFNDTLSLAGVNVTMYGKFHIGAGFKSPTGFDDDTFKGSWSRAASIEKPCMNSEENGTVTNSSDRLAPWRYNGKTHKDPKTIKACLKVLRSLPQDGSASPQLLHCSFFTPHPPFDTNETFLDEVDPKKIIIPPQQDCESMHPANRWTSVSKRHCGNVTDEQIRKVRHIYTAMGKQLDDWLGQLLRAVEQRADNAAWYIVYLSDHGELQMEHRQTLKNSMFDGSVRVPMIWAGPGIRKNISIDAPVSLLDVYPTLHDLFDAAKPEFLSGRSLYPLLRGPADIDAARPDFVTSQYHSDYSNVGSFMVATRDYKLLVYGTHRNVNAKDYTPQLYRLDGSDPFEMHDIASERPEVVVDLQRRLDSEFDWRLADREAKDQDLSLFLNATVQHQWDAAGSNCRAAMSSIYDGFDAADAERLSQWSGRSCGGFEEIPIEV